jgi:hypothetical protein
MVERRSISAPTAAIWSASPATLPRFSTTRRAFDYYLGGTFAALAIVLLLTTIFQVRFGLAPLKRISQSLADIRSGRAERLEGEFPGRDRAAGARDQRADRRQPRDRRARAHPCRQSRARAQDAAVGDRQRGLARSGDDPFAAKVLEQTDVMRDQVRIIWSARGSRARHRRRHRHRGRAGGRGAARTMEKIHRDRGIAIDLEAIREARSAASGRISRRWSATSSTTPANGRLAGLHRGAGGAAGRRERAADAAHRRRRRRPGPVAPAARAGARRGQRLDETKPGSGLGLSIVVDLAALYGGSLTLGTAPIGGLRAELVLPVEDLLPIGSVLQAREALDTLNSRLPSHLRVFAESQIASVTAALNVPSLQTPQLLPFALSLIMQRLARRGRSSASPSRWRRPTTKSALPPRPTASPSPSRCTICPSSRPACARISGAASSTMSASI